MCTIIRVTSGRNEIHDLDWILPDWVTHLGTTYIAAGTAGRFSPRLARSLEMRYLLLGALLPDVTRFTVILVDILDWPAVPTFTYLIPFHSLLIVGLLSGAIALLLVLYEVWRVPIYRPLE